ncbi:MAG TPA: hypothetical protein VEY12_13160 [Thermoplasmata archaeon]|nr:hypothetical protein [Thermoplasmata archaeon]
MAEAKRVLPAGRILLAVGGVLLLVALFLPWFGIGGNQSQLPAKDYNGIDLTTLLNNLAKGPYAWLAFAWLLIVAFLAFVAAGIARKIANFGTSGVLVLILYAILLIVAQNLVNQNATSGNATVALEYGFIVAIIGAACIEAGMRLFKAPAAPQEQPPAAAESKPATPAAPPVQPETPAP